MKARSKTCQNIEILTYVYCISYISLSSMNVLFEYAYIMVFGVCVHVIYYSDDKSEVVFVGSALNHELFS